MTSTFPKDNIFWAEFVWKIIQKVIEGLKVIPNITFRCGVKMAHWGLECLSLDRSGQVTT